MGRLNGKVALVTGAANGLGEASARRLAAEGAHIIGIDIDDQGLSSVIEGLAGTHLAITADVSNEDAVQAALRAAIDKFGHVDLHHINAGIFGSLAPFPELSTADFDHVVSVNLRGTFLCLREAFRIYHEQHRTGAVVITASIASRRGSADLLPYQATKHGVLGLMRGAAVYGGPIGVRVNAVAPGIVPTGLFAAAADEPGGGNDMVQRASTSPLRRAGTAEEIAAVVAFLLSDDAAYVTGEVVAADGGAGIVNTVRPSGGAGAWDTTSADRATYQNLV